MLNIPNIRGSEIINPATGLTVGRALTVCCIRVAFDNSKLALGSLIVCESLARAPS